MVYILPCILLLFLLIFGAHQWRLHSEKTSEILQKQKHFHVYLRQKVSELDPLPNNQMFIGEFNLTLYDSLLKIQNDFFDSVKINGFKKEVEIRLVIPPDIKDWEVNEYIDYQALNYILILNKLLPNNNFMTIRFVAFRRDVFSTEKHMVYDFKGITESDIDSYQAFKIRKYVVKQ